MPEMFKYKKYAVFYKVKFVYQVCLNFEQWNWEWCVQSVLSQFLILDDILSIVVPSIYSTDLSCWQVSKNQRKQLSWRQEDHWTLSNIKLEVFWLCFIVGSYDSVKHHSVVFWPHWCLSKAETTGQLSSSVL